MEVVETWLRGAKEERELLLRATGVFGSDLDWRLLRPPGRSSSATEVVLNPNQKRPVRVRHPVMESATSGR